MLLFEYCAIIFTKHLLLELFSVLSSPKWCGVVMVMIYVAILTFYLFYESLLCSWWQVQLYSSISLVIFESEKCWNFLTGLSHFHIFQLPGNSVLTLTTEMASTLYDHPLMLKTNSTKHTTIPCTYGTENEHIKQGSLLAHCTWYQTGREGPSQWCLHPGHVAVQPAASPLTPSAADWPELRGPAAPAPPPPAHAHLHANKNVHFTQTVSSHHCCVFFYLM